MDPKHSGHITFAKLLAMVRGELRLSAAALPTLMLECVWRVLDADASGHISFSTFRDR